MLPKESCGGGESFLVRYREDRTGCQYLGGELMLHLKALVRNVLQRCSSSRGGGCLPEALRSHLAWQHFLGNIDQKCSPLSSEEHNAVCEYSWKKAFLGQAIF